MREAIWLNLAKAEGELRSSEILTSETLDFDADGSDEVWVHSPRFSAVVSPARGGAIIEYTIFEDGINYADVLTRRSEAYHETALGEAARAGRAAAEAKAAGKAMSHKSDSGVPSIHDLEHSMTLVERPAIDLDDRALFVDRILSADVTALQHSRAEYEPLKSWARVSFDFSVIGEDRSVEIVCAGDGIEKRIRFAEDGVIDVSWKWDASGFPDGARFTSEISLFRPREIETTPDADRWTAPVETVAKSEKGLDRTVQGESVTLLWKASLGEAGLRIRRSG